MAKLSGRLPASLASALVMAFAGGLAAATVPDPAPVAAIKGLPRVGERRLFTGQVRVR